MLWTLKSPTKIDLHYHHQHRGHTRWLGSRVTAPFDSHLPSKGAFYLSEEPVTRCVALLLNPLVSFPSLWQYIHCPPDDQFLPNQEGRHFLDGQLDCPDQDLPLAWLRIDHWQNFYLNTPDGELSWQLNGEIHFQIGFSNCERLPKGKSSQTF